MCYVVSQTDKEGVGGIIFWLDAVCRVVLLRVEQAACKKSQLCWLVCVQADQFQPKSYIIIDAGPSVCMQADQFQPISYIIIAAGPPAMLYHSWSSSWRVKQENRIASEDVHIILLTAELEVLEHFHNVWMLVGHKGRSIINSENFVFNIACQQSVLIRVGNKRGEK
jgi:hypothetical protein